MAVLTALMFANGAERQPTGGGQIQRLKITIEISR
jgi:hypothetical protein